MPITDAFETARGNTAAYATNTKRYLVGPAVRFNLPARFSLEIDALYKRLGYQYDQFAPTLDATTKTVANSWEFPVLGQFAILPGPITPFLELGASFRHISGVKQIRSVATAGNRINTELNSAPEFNKRSDIGFVFGGGVEFRAGRLRISPGLRYTRWGSENFRDPVNSFLRTNRNQGDFVIGLLF